MSADTLFNFFTDTILRLIMKKKIVIKFFTIKIITLS